MFVLQRASDVVPAYTVQQICRKLEITYNTYLNWERLGLAPRRFRTCPGRQEVIPRPEFQAWSRQRDLDRKRLGKWHLKHPIKPLSWMEAGNSEQGKAATESVAARNVTSAVSHADAREGTTINPIMLTNPATQNFARPTLPVLGQTSGQPLASGSVQ